MIGKTIPTPMASIIKVVKMKRKGPVSFILLTDILVLLHKRRCAAIELNAKKQQIKNFHIKRNILLSINSFKI
jgi:hypothetical protein